MTYASNRLNSVHFGSDPLDIRIWINLEIQIWIPDDILALAEFTLSEFLCIYVISLQWAWSVVVVVAAEPILDICVSK